MLLDNYVYSDGCLKIIILQNFGLIEALFGEKYPSNYGDIYTNITNAVWSLFLTQWSIHSGLFEFWNLRLCSLWNYQKSKKSVRAQQCYANIPYSWENENFLIQN